MDVRRFPAREPTGLVDSGFTMLVRLYGRNFRSLKGDFELSAVAADLKRKEDRDRGVIEVPIAGFPEPLRVLRVLAIYGPNASGKSTVLYAGAALNWLVTQSSARSRPDATIPPYEPFLLDNQSNRSPVKLGCDVAYDKSLLKYEITFESKVIQTEVLTILNGEGEKTLLDRQPTGEIGGQLIERSQANRLYVKGMQPNVSVLSKLAQHGPQQGHESVGPFYRAIRDATRHEDYSDAIWEKIELSPNDMSFADDDHYREWIMDHLMIAADIGICDVNIRREPLTVPKAIKERFEGVSDGIKFPDSRPVVSFVHEGDVRRPLDFLNESMGTRKILNLAKDWWTLAHQPAALLADELGASLHPQLLGRLIRAVNDPPGKRVRSQLIFATHDVGLLESQNGQPPALRRDQVYFTKKDTKGVTELYSLAEFRDDARAVHNIRKRYLSGQYGAIPLVEKLSL